MFDVNGTENVESTKRSYHDDSDETGNGYEIVGDRPGDFFTSQLFLRPRASAPEKHQTTHSPALPPDLPPGRGVDRGRRRFLRRHPERGRGVFL